MYSCVTRPFSDLYVTACIQGVCRKWFGQQHCKFCLGHKEFLGKLIKHIEVLIIFLVKYIKILYISYMLRGSNGDLFH